VPLCDNTVPVSDFIISGFPVIVRWELQLPTRSFGTDPCQQQNRFMSISVVSSKEGDLGPYEPLVDHLQSVSLEEHNQKYKVVQWLHFAASFIFLVFLIAFAATDMDATIKPVVLKPVNCEDFCEVDIDHQGDFNFRFFIPLILAIAYIHHLVCFLVCYLEEFTAELWMFSLGSNPMRWMEYSLTFSLTTVIVAILSGVMDIHLWFLLFLATALGMGFWQVMELLPRVERPDIWAVSFRSLRLLCFWLGAVAVYLPWLVVFCFYARMVDDDTPSFVSTAVLGLCAIYVALGVNAYLSKVMHAYDFCTSEVVYISLSLVAKLYLAVNIYAGLKK